MRWLHISDLHFGYDTATIETMRKKLLQLAEKTESIDCLFITGDLRYAKVNKTDYPDETLAFIRQLQEALKVRPEDTFVVPGNHDVNRDEILRPGIEEAIKSYSTSNGLISDDTLSHLKAQRAPFLSLYQQICGREEPGWHYCLPKNGFNIICLNTALFCCKDGEDGSLIVGSQLLNQLSDTVDSSRPGIVLAHHDFDALSLDERRNLELVLKDMGATLYLCGHKHVAHGYCQHTYRTNQDLHVFLCGTNMDADPNLDQTDMDVFVGEVDDAGQCGYIQAYKWNRRFREWTPDADFSFPQGRATDGKRYFPENTRPAPPQAPSQEIALRYQQFIRSQCNEIELSGLPTNAEDVARKYALARIFVPLGFRPFKEQDDDDLPEAPLESIADFHDWYERYIKSKAPVRLDDLIPSAGGFHRFVLSDPGGGKTTLLKWIASVYSFPSDYTETDTHLPPRELFPIWIRCRDIPEENRLTIWSIIENIARLGEWMPDASVADDFMRLVSHHIHNGTALLLIDGLDEIGNDSKRLHFMNQLHTFITSNPEVNTILTSRVAGFRSIIKEISPDCECFEIAPLSKRNIEELCANWYKIVYGEQAEFEKKAESLADVITKDERIFRLARNPLMLTTLLLVERRVGRLPTKRVALYDEAIQVLLETWNQNGHDQEKINLEEARYQLAYVAFHMMTQHIQRISKTQLSDLLRSGRQEFPDLISSREPIASFVDKIEKRSALLIQKGYEQLENGTLEAVYEFQHLTFQEYLAAFAVANSCYPESTDEYCRKDALLPYLLDATMKEVISLTAVLDRFCAQELTSQLLATIKGRNSLGGHKLLRDILLQFIADEVQLKDELVDKILNCCFENTIWSSDTKMMSQILDGRYAENLRCTFINADKNKHNGCARWGSILDVLSGEIADPYAYFMNHRNSTSFRQQADALAVLGAAFWVKRLDTATRLNEAEKAELKQALFHFSESKDKNVQEEMLYVLRDGEILETKEDISTYIAICIKYVNEFKQVPPLKGQFLLAVPARMNIEHDNCITEEAFHNICTEVKKKNFVTDGNYEDLLALTLILATCHLKQSQLSAVFSLTKEKYHEALALDPSLFSSFLSQNYKLSNALQRAILLEPFYDLTEKRIIEEYILKTDLESASKMEQDGNPAFQYNDCSLFDGTSFMLTYPDNSLDEVIGYIQARLEDIENAETGSRSQMPSLELCR